MGSTDRSAAVRRVVAVATAGTAVAMALWFVCDPVELHECASNVDGDGVTAETRLATVEDAAAPHELRATRDEEIAETTEVAGVAPLLDLAAVIDASGDEGEAWPEVAATVVRAQDGAPIPFASVTVYRRASVQCELTGQADRDGRFRMRVAFPSMVVVEADGFGGEAAVIDGEVDAATEPLRFELRRPFALVGRVVDADGAAVEGAAVYGIGLVLSDGYCDRALGLDFVQWRTNLGPTDAQGRFGPIDCHASGVVAFEVEVERRRVLFAPRRLDGVAGATTEVQLLMPPRCSLAVAVHRLDGTPSPDLDVEIERSFDAWSCLDADQSTGDDGRREYELELPGRYHVSARTGCEPHDDVAVSDVEIKAGANEIELIDPRPAPPPESPQARHDAEESKAEPASIVGRVVRARELEPDDRATVILLRSSGWPLESVECDSDGSFHVDDVKPGIYFAIVLCTGHRRFDAPPIEIAAGAQIVLPDWPLAACDSLHGRVVDPHGNAVAGASVALGVVFPRDQVFTASGFTGIEPVTTGDDGRFAFDLFDPTALLVVEVAGLPRVVWHLDRHRDNDDVVVEAGGRRAVRGRIVGAGGLPNARMIVSDEVLMTPEQLIAINWDLPKRPEPAEAEVAPDGTFTLPVVPTSASDLVLSLITAGEKKIARRHLPAGIGDLDLGDWVLPIAKD